MKTRILRGILVRLVALVAWLGIYALGIAGLALGFGFVGLLVLVAWWTTRLIPLEIVAGIGGMVLLGWGIKKLEKQGLI